MLGVEHKGKLVWLYVAEQEKEWYEIRDIGSNQISSNFSGNGKVFGLCYNREWESIECND